MRAVAPAFGAAPREADSSGRVPLRSAPRIAMVGVALGVLGQLLFFGAAPGLNVPLATAALLIAGWRSRPPSRGLRMADAWLPATACAYATFVALRDDPALIALDLLAVVALTGAALASFAGMDVSSRPPAALLALAGRLGAWVAVAAGWVLIDVRARAPSRGRMRSTLARGAPVVRGLVLALPLALLFVALFSAADAVFAEVVGDLFGLDVDLDEFTGRVLLGLALGWLSAGAVAFVAAGRPAERPPDGQTDTWPRLGTIEAVTLLMVVDVVFAIFVALQAAYLFGGLDTLAATGLTYAEYARRGFFELIAVSVLAGLVVLALEHVVVRRSAAYLTGAIGLALLTAVVLASATLRLRLYQDAYGWTELRFYALAIIAWLAVGVGTAVITIVTNRSRWLLHAMIASALTVGLVVNAIGPVRLVAEQNVTRLIEPSRIPSHGLEGLDTAYLGSLGLDAVPVLVEALPRIDPAYRREVRLVFASQRAALQSPALAGWQSWNLSREHARAALQDLVSEASP